MASESGHWYTREGAPAYTVIGKNGRERATTIRDAREHGWLPSVTTITACAARFGLETWKQQQVLLAALTLPRLDGEADSDFIKRVMADSKEQASKAAEHGTAIHAAVERHYAGQDAVPEYAPWVKAAVECVQQAFGEQEWKPEKSFADLLNGYGGKVDLHSDKAVVDFKTKDGDLSGVKLWDDHFMQLAAYSAGLGRATATCGIVFISRTEPKAMACILSTDELDRGWRMFSALLDYWKAANL